MKIHAKVTIKLKMSNYLAGGACTTRVMFVSLDARHTVCVTVLITISEIRLHRLFFFSSYTRKSSFYRAFTIY